MGVFHFMGLGQAVGAVTCPLDYIEQALQKKRDNQANAEIEKLFGGSGGISHREDDIGKIEALVLFSSPEVIKNSLKAFKYAGCEHPGPVKNEIEKQVGKIWKTRPKAGARIFWVEVDINNYQDCFDKVLQVAYRFSPPDKQGKEIWCNMTGGSNTIQMALLSVARLTGFSTKHYIISQKPGHREEITVPKEIQIAPDKDGYFNTLPFLKFTIDSFEFYDILEELAEKSGFITNQELFDRLRGKQHFLDVNLDEFIDRYLLKLYGQGLTELFPQKGGTRRVQAAEQQVKISDAGIDFILGVLQPIRERLNPKGTNWAEEAKTWSWFSESSLPDIYQ